jgi:molecular chaperone GrpE
MKDSHAGTPPDPKSDGTGGKAAKPATSPSSDTARDALFADDGGEALAKLEQQLAEALDRELKAQAELENFRKRMYRETEQTVKYANLPLVRDLLEVLDNLARATEAAGAATDSSGLLAGVKMVQQQMTGVLERHHCRPINALGQAFDPNVHQAIAQSPSDEYAAGQVMLEASVGFLLHDRVIRPSHVIVSTGKA